MIRRLQNRVLETIARHSMLRPGNRVGAGVSGGADSVALLQLLAELRGNLGVAVFVLHFHHQLRGIEADEDERFVKALAEEFGFEFISDRADVGGEARRNGWNLEDTGRRLRYQFFGSAAAAQRLDRVAVAHSADDQAETVLAHILRGTGLAGLAGIYPVAGLIIRPLLEIGREELREYLSAAGRSWREDASNRDTSRVRARIRHQLLPLLRRDFEPSSVTRLARLASLAREEEMFWRALEEERMSDLVIRESSGAISLKIGDLLSPLPLLSHVTPNLGPEFEFPKSTSLALSRRLVRRILAELRGTRQQLTAVHIQYVLDLAVRSHGSARIELPGIRVERTFDRLVFSVADTHPEAVFEIGNGKPRLTNHGFEYSISLSDASETRSIVVPEIQRRFILKVIDWSSASRETINYTGVLDFETLRWPLVLRNWHPGDSYRPQGHQRVRKLKRLFLESRVPRETRATWPVLISAGQLAWASGYPAADEFAPHLDTKIGLAIVEVEFAGKGDSETPTGLEI